MTKEQEIMAFLHEKVFDPILNGEVFKQGQARNKNDC